MAEDGTNGYMVNIVYASLRLAIAKADAGVIVAHKKAFFAFAKSPMKTYSVPKKQFAFSVDDLLQGRFPQRIIMGFYVDGQPATSQPLQPKYSRGLYTEAYDTLKKNGSQVVDISLSNYKKVYCLYVIVSRIPAI